MPTLQWAKKARISCFFLAFLAITAQTDDGTINATYSRGAFRVSIPRNAAHEGGGTLTVEILDPEDSVCARVQKHLSIQSGNGDWREELKLAQPLETEDLIWYRLRYRFQYDNPRLAPIAGVQSISQILRRPVLRVLGEPSYLAGGPAAVRVIVMDSANQTIAGSGSVRIELAQAGSAATILYSGALNRRGTTEAQFRFPGGVFGAQRLHYVVDTDIGSTELTQNVTLEDKSQILLTTEKPLYQPGQTIHARALALDRLTRNASANRSLTFDLQDSRGNKVFKKITQTDEFGIASAEFGLADEVNLGNYHLHAILDGVSKSSSELTVDVERYVLPKFKVELELAGKEFGYRPGDRVTGTVRANYFFGKPVDRGEVTVKASGMDVAVFEAASTAGRTDADGNWRFDLELPKFFAGRPVTQGAARVLVEAEVKDSAGHSETRGAPITVSESPILITAVPEGGTLAPNLDNQVFLLTSFADGQPARTHLTVHRPEGTQEADTDESGVAVIQFRADSRGESLQVEARDRAGNHAGATLPLAVRGNGDQILLRTDRAIYRAGDSIRLQVFSTRAHGTAYLDIVKEGQTILTRDVDLADGHAELTVPATPDLAGTIDCDAYLIGQDARVVGDHRLAFVQPADELKIETSTDRAVYKPGDDARIRFRVTNAGGEGVRAALGLQIVDEAVFALAEQKPGFAKVFFYLEQEVMKPRYEIHSLAMPAVLTSAAASRDLAGRALFAATGITRFGRFDREEGRTLPLTKRADYVARYFKQYELQVNRLAAELMRRGARNPASDQFRDLLERLRAAHDPLTLDAWGSELRIDQPSWQAWDVYRLTSPGGDKVLDNGDDMVLYLQVQYGKLASRIPGGKIDLTLDSNQTPALPEVRGAVLDERRLVVRDASVTLRSKSTGRTIAVRSDADGQFRFADVKPGEYTCEISAPGFRVASRHFLLQLRDRAILSASLDDGGPIERITVTPNLPSSWGQGSGGGIGNGKGGSVGFGNGGGFGSGVGGGVGGGVYRVRGTVASPLTLNGSIPQALVNENLPDVADTGAAFTADEEDGTPAHVRSWFPESLYINPEIITDGDGTATIAIPMADSITTWHAAMIASTTRGAIGSSTASMKVFQDFFADLDLPITLTQGDRVSIPVALYNYSGSDGKVALQLQPADWYALVSDVPRKTVDAESGKVAGSQFTLEARKIGKFKLILSARLTGGAARADVLVREIEVVPNGREQTVVYNGRLENSVEHAVDFPAAAIAGASKIFVRLYPGPLSQVIEGMDSILRMPGGCFEQTSSSTYPNVLALDYMKRTNKLTPEVRAKAEGYIANGYQRLLTFEVPGGGFSWFGQRPANKILTAYGLMEFSDMSKVYDVDANVIPRTQQWLAAQQQGDGSWQPDTQFINEGATNRYNSDVLRITAYIAWALENSGFQGPAVEKARAYIEQHLGGTMDAYTLAVLANFAVDYSQDRAFAGRAVALLMAAAHTENEQISWTAEETGVYGRGLSAGVETTGLAAQALLKWGGESAAAAKALAYLAGKKDATGAWGTTQATIMALRAILLSTEKGAADVRGPVEVTLNGKTVERLELTPENNDLLHQFVFKAQDLAERNAIAIHFAGKGALAYQLAGSYFLPWDTRPANEPLSIDVAYDRSTLEENAIATATATVRNNLGRGANMVMVDLGIPPGFDLLSEDLDDYQQKSAGLRSGRLQKFSLTATQAILYFDSFAPGDTVKLSFRLRAKYPIRARTFPSRAYEYYQPEVSAVARPVQLEVRAK